MNKDVVVTSAPGKMLVVGAYAILEEGNVGYTIGINKRCYAKFEPREEGITFNLPQFDVNEYSVFDGKKIIGDNLRDESLFVRNSVELSLRYLDEKDIGLESFGVETINDPAFTYRHEKSKSGLGSSSAITAATVAGVFEFHKLKIDDYRDEIHKIAQLAHSKSQNKIGSGFDIALTVFGSNIYKRYKKTVLTEDISNDVASLIDSDWGYSIKPVAFPKDFNIAVAYTGQSASTKKFVERIKIYKKIHEDDYNKAMKDLNEQNKKTVDLLLELGNEYSDAELQEFGHNFQKTWEMTANLGYICDTAISTYEFEQMVESALDNGAICSKLPGAGGGDSIVAICDSLSAKENVIDAWETEYGLKAYPDIDIDDRSGVCRVSEWEYESILERAMGDGK